jgi:hypothetical protein
MAKGVLSEILRSQQTVFTFKELLMRRRTTATKTLKNRINYYVQRGDLYHIRRGLYAKDKNYDRLELVTKILTPSYISFETVLRAAGIIFQYYSQIFVATYQSREIICDGQTYVFRSLKPIILTNTVGIEIKDTYSIASPERAFLDIVYLHKGYYFDNLQPLNWDKVNEILPVYGDNKRMKQKVALYRRTFEADFLKTSK